jgi:glutathionylspermidine synthase
MDAALRCEQAISADETPRRAPMRPCTWPIDERHLGEVLRALSFDYLKWDLYLNGTCRVLPESIVLSRETHAQLVRATEAFTALMRRFENRVRRDPDVLEALGIAAALAPLIAAESPREPAFGRADFFLTPAGDWVLSEFNEDAPGGFNEAAGIPALLDDAMLGGQRTGALPAALCGAFADCDAVGLVLATAFSEDLQHCALLEKWLRGAGHATARGAPDHLRCGLRGVRLGARPIEGLFRFYPGEWLRLLPDLTHWIKALPRLSVLNAPVRLLTQSKRCFGLWQRDDGLDADERSLVARYCPPTGYFDPAQVERYRGEREGLVLKRAFGRMGDAVLIGALASPKDWDEALAIAARQPREFAVQRRFVVAPLHFAAGTMYPTVGVYTVNGRFAGYYSRVAAQPFITHEAYHVATVLEAA